MRALREASVTMLAAAATLLCTVAIEPEPGPAALAVVLCLSLSRSQLDRNRRGRIEALIALPVVGLVAVGVGTLLRTAPWLGALAFVLGLFLSIWVRRFGPMWRRAGSLIALPFVALLTVPYLPHTATGSVPPAMVPAIIALLAVAWVGALHALARRAHFLPPVPELEQTKSAPTGAASLRPIASTRMAIQMATALATAFVVGHLYFAERCAWIVLTAFIVQSGNRGRLEVAYKSVLRMVGAATGTLLAIVLSGRFGAHDGMTVVMMLGALFLGVWLRPLNYAWWALFVTVALALLQGFEGSSASLILWPRLEEIAIGAIIGVASAWWVLPVHSTAVLRRRIADALSSLANALDPSKPVRMPADFAAAVARVEEMAPAFRAGRLVTRHFRALQPADWVDALVACRDPAIALIESTETPGPVRRAVGAARQSIREPRNILPALQELRGSLVR